MSPRDDDTAAVEQTVTSSVLQIDRFICLVGCLAPVGQLAKCCRETLLAADGSAVRTKK